MTELAQRLRETYSDLQYAEQVAKFLASEIEQERRERDVLTTILLRKFAVNGEVRISNSDIEDYATCDTEIYKDPTTLDTVIRISHRSVRP